jgi:4-hydroxy-2-oxoheptanedioate aldolase
MSTLQTDWQAGNATFGAWCALPSPGTIEALCVPGVRYVCLDQQHGFFNDGSLVDGFRAIERCGAVPFARVAANRDWMIGKALDAGAHGVIVPLVEERDAAAAAVAACRFSPRGVRSFGPTRAQLFHKPETAQGFEDVLCFVMVETKRGLDNVDAIAATPGLTGIYIGPSDLALALGHDSPTGPESPHLRDAIERIAAACARNGIVAGIHCTEGGAARRFGERGFRLVTCFKDTTLVTNAALKEVAAAHGRNATPKA